MRQVTFVIDGTVQAGLLVGDSVVAAVEAARHCGVPIEGWSSVRSSLELDDSIRAKVADAAASLASSQDAPGVFSRRAVRLGPPVPNPDKVILLALNYQDHVDELGLTVPDVPPIFAKFPNSLVGCADDVRLPASSSQVDWEGELAVVIGRTASRVSENDALDHVAGYTVLNDISARDLQYLTSQYTIGKACDDFAPCGPALVTADEVADCQDLALTTWLNGEVVQSANTSQMIWSVAKSISWLSQIITLVPGDIISTGTPAGVGANRKPPVFMKPGDLCEVEIEGLGKIANRMVAEKER